MEKRLRTWLNNKIHQCDAEIMDRESLCRSFSSTVRTQKKTYIEVLDFLDSLGE